MSHVYRVKSFILTQCQMYDVTSTLNEIVRLNYANRLKTVTKLKPFQILFCTLRLTFSL